ncbi:MAG: J domain-containing protein [Gammaproteobacteria bacterium]|nr:MAG: J domain-containing protein [Gammaproteobacteria bacterium]
MEFRDYYKILGVDRSASESDIKRAYRKMARKYHPDVSDEKDAEERFKEINEAYEVLKDPQKRAAYDQLGNQWKAGQDFQPPPGWDQQFEFHGGGFTDTDRGGFSDFFETLFGQHGFGQGFRRSSEGRRWHIRGEDTFARVNIDLEDAYHGATRTFALKQAELDQQGRRILKTRQFKVNIPKGVYSGQHIRLTGQGSPGVGQAPNGDLYIEIGFNPHPLYKVEGKDVYLDVPIAPWEAELGAQIQVPSPTGNVNLKIPPHTRTGRKFRLKGKGIPAKTPGDFYVVLHIQLPEAHTEKEKQAYLSLKQAFDFNPRAGFGVKS